jgi:hypothetical protein
MTEILRHLSTAHLNRGSSRLAENASAKLTVPLLAEIAKYGVARVKRVYVDWTKRTERLEWTLLNSGRKFQWQTSLHNGSATSRPVCSPSSGRFVAIARNGSQKST